MPATVADNRRTTAGTTTTLVAACLIAVLFPTSITGTSVTLPNIAADLGGGLAGLQWVVHAYDLTFAAFLLAMGSLSDVLGRRRVFAFGTTLFTVASIGAALSTNLLFLDIARGVTGIGAAAAFTSVAAALAQAFDGAARARAFGLFGTCFGFGLAFGPLLGGGLSSSLGWRYFFAAQAIAASVSLVLSRRIASSKRNPDAKVDWAGTATFVGALFLLILGLVEGPQLGWGSPGTISMLVGSVILLVGFVAVEHRQDAPMFDLALFRSRRYVAICLSPVALAFGFVALLVFLPTYFIAVDGVTPWDAGLMMLMLTLPTLIMPAIAGNLAAKGISHRTLLVACMLLVGAGTLWLLTLRQGLPVWQLAGPLLTIGVGFGISNGILDAAAVGAVEPHRAGMATGMFGTMRITGEVIAIAAMGSLIVSLTARQLRGNVGQLAGTRYSDNPGGLANSMAKGDLTTPVQDLQPQARAAFHTFASASYSSGMHQVLIILSACCLVMVPLLLVLLRGDRNSTGTVAPSAEEATEAAGVADLVGGTHQTVLSRE
jgi:MFS family permease